MVLLSALVLLLGVASPAEAVNCSDSPYFGVIDGTVFPSPPSQIQIDDNCTVLNYPESNPLTTNFSFQQPAANPGPWLIIFNNVFHTGNMACNAVQGHHIWFVNGSSSKIHQNCQNLLIPVEKINKQNPVGQTTASIGASPTRSRSRSSSSQARTSSSMNSDRRTSSTASSSPTISTRRTSTSPT
jgi:hypothetical protein